jgi:DNA-directed RNA polymerase sigma subunit (sigma70/sigma32)
MSDPLEQRATVRELAEAIVDLDADVEERVLASLEAARLRRRIVLLGSLERRVLVWRYGIAGAERLSRREIASRLGLTAAQVRGIEERALELLRGGIGTAAA